MNSIDKMLDESVALNDKLFQQVKMQSDIIAALEKQTKLDGQLIDALKAYIKLLEKPSLN